MSTFETPSPIKTAIIGYGRAGQLQHGPQLESSADYVVSAVVTSSQERALLARTAHPSARIVDSVDGLWEMSEDLDLVVIAAPNDVHVAFAREAIRLGLAVVIDKPLATTTADARALIDEASDAGVPLTVYQNRRWDGDYLTVQDLVGSGALGEVYEFESRFTWWEPVPPETWKAAAAARDGGGAVWDLGPHLIDQAIRLFGPVAEWSAELDSRRPQSASDDTSLVLLTHESGVRSRLWMSCVAAQAGPRFRILGSAGAFTKPGLDPQESQAESGMSPADPAFGIDAEAAWGTLGIDGHTSQVETARGTYETFYWLLALAVRGEGALPVDPAECLVVLELIEAIYGLGRFEGKRDSRNQAESEINVGSNT